jgi:hypothetical protein
MAKLVGKDGKSGESRLPDGSRGWIGSLILLMGIVFAGPGITQSAPPPLPPPRPDRPALPKPQNDKAPSQETGEQKASEANDPDADACIERLNALGLRFEKREPVQEEACSIKNPVSVSRLPNGVEVVPASLMECSFAEGLTRWIDEVVIPRTREHLQSAPTKLLIGTSYQCRDQRSGSKLSEHAFGNGVDGMGFEFDGHPPLTIRSQPEGSPEEAYQSAIRKEACAVFSTVLGPGAEDHEDHLHLDMRVRKGDYRICQ